MEPSTAAELSSPSVLEVEIEELREQVRHLETALGSSRDIGAAIGILMQRHAVAQPVAFGLLAHLSQHLNTPLRDLAKGLVLTGELPALPVARDTRHPRPGRSQRHEATNRPGAQHVTAAASQGSSR